MYMYWCLLCSDWRVTHGHEPTKSGSISLERNSQILGRYLLAPAPLILQFAALFGKDLRQSLNGLSDKGIRLLDSLLRVINECSLDGGPAITKRPGILLIKEWRRAGG